MPETPNSEFSMFVRRKWSTIKGRKKLAEWYSRPVPSSAFEDVKLHERIARKVLTEHGIDEWPTRLPEVLKGSPEIVLDADEILRDISFLHEAITEGDGDGIIYHSLRIGHNGCRLLARIHEPNALTGQKVRAGAEKGHAIKYGSAVEKANRRRQYVDRWTELRQEHPELSKQGCDAKVAEEFGRKPKTIQRARNQYLK